MTIVKWWINKLNYSISAALNYVQYTCSRIFYWLVTALWQGDALLSPCQHMLTTNASSLSYIALENRPCYEDPSRTMLELLDKCLAFSEVASYTRFQHRFGISSDAKHVSVTYFLLLELGTPYDFVCREPQLYSRAMLYSVVVSLVSNPITSLHVTRDSTSRWTKRANRSFTSFRRSGTKKGIIGLSTWYIFKKGCKR